MPDTRSIRFRNWRANTTTGIDLTHCREASATTRIGVPEGGQKKRFPGFIGLRPVVHSLLLHKNPRRASCCAGNVIAAPSRQVKRAQFLAPSCNLPTVFPAPFSGKILLAHIVVTL